MNESFIYIWVLTYEYSYLAKLKDILIIETISLFAVVNIDKVIDVIDEVVINLSEVVVEALDKVDEVKGSVVVEVIDVVAVVGFMAPVVEVVIVEGEIELEISVNFKSKDRLSVNHNLIVDIHRFTSIRCYKLTTIRSVFIKHQVIPCLLVIAKAFHCIQLNGF